MKNSGLILFLCAVSIPVAGIAQIFTEPKAPPAPKPQQNPKPKLKKVAPKPVVKAAPSAQPPQAKPAKLPAMVGVMPRNIIGKWRIFTKSGLLQSDFLIGIELTGGTSGGIVGNINYWHMVPDREPSHSCSSTLILVSHDNSTFVSDEQMMGKGLFCPGGDVVSLRLTDGKLWAVWSKKRKGELKPRMQGFGERVK